MEGSPSPSTPLSQPRLRGATQVASSNRSSNRLFDVPLETRQAIYRRVFNVFTENDLELCVCCNTTATFSKPPVQILAACRQLHDEALPTLLEILAGTKLVFSMDNPKHIALEPGKVPWTWLLEKHGGLFRGIEWNTSGQLGYQWPDRLLAVLGAFPNLERLEIVADQDVIICEEDIGDNIRDIDADYLVNLSNDDELWEVILAEEKYYGETWDPGCSNDWMHFVESGKDGARPFKLVLWARVGGMDMHAVGVQYDMDTGKVVEKQRHDWISRE